ncbi:MAG: winged helix-turn-helix transcriptional regulator [Actinobacteria bacterium]|nr:winged helix-turn-helix transcriptional regulator [Actinomycetota bacterium]
MEALNVLADPTRLAILESLTKEPASVGAVADRFPISRPAMSRHLRLLRDAGLVESVTDGTRHIYRVRPQGIEAVRRYMDQLWNDAAARYKITVENLKDQS